MQVVSGCNFLKLNKWGRYLTQFVTGTGLRLHSTREHNINKQWFQTMRLPEQGSLPGVIEASVHSESGCGGGGDADPAEDPPSYPAPTFGLSSRNPSCNTSAWLSRGGREAPSLVHLSEMTTNRLLQLRVMQFCFHPESHNVFVELSFGRVSYFAKYVLCTKP